MMSSLPSSPLPISFGAFHAANQFFRRPDLFDCLIGMSGFYDLEWLLHGYSDENVYFNNPMWFVANMNDPAQLDLLRNHSQIHLISGQGAWEVPPASQRFSTLLWSKSIPHNLDLWGHDIPHDWPSWHKMLDYYIGERLGW
jgi:esterase/lipase superfamily enzyme